MLILPSKSKKTCCSVFHVSMTASVLAGIPYKQTQSLQYNSARKRHIRRVKKIDIYTKGVAYSFILFTGILWNSPHSSAFPSSYDFAAFKREEPKYFSNLFSGTIYLMGAAIWVFLYIYFCSLPSLCPFFQTFSSLNTPLPFPLNL